MAVTFNPALPEALDRIRQRIGDTVVATAQVQDETILAYLTAGMTELRTARRLCLDLAAKWAPAGDVTLDDQMQRASKIYEHYLRMADEIGAEDVGATAISSGIASIVVGGLTDTRGPLDGNFSNRELPWWAP